MPLELTPRRGERPKTRPVNPHSQLDQNPSREMHARMAARMFPMDGVVEQGSMVSVPGARALVVPPGKPAGPRDAFLVEREFAHLHPASDGSLHVAVPPAEVEAVIAAGWGEVHPMARRGMIPPNVLMVFAPRDEQEIELVMRIVEASRARALGEAA